MQKIISVSVDNRSKAVDRLFDYSVPDEFLNLVKKGSRVIVPFGNGNKMLEGYVIDVKPKDYIPQYETKHIYDIVEEETFLNEEMIDLAIFLKDKYKCTLNECIRTIVPSCMGLKERIFITKGDDINAEGLSGKRARVISLLEEHGKLEFKKLNTFLDNSLSRGDIFNMEKLGILKLNSQMKSSSRKKFIEVCVLGDSTKCFQFIDNSLQKYKRQIDVLKCIINNEEELTITQLCDKYNCSSSVIKGLLDKGLLVKKSKQIIRNANNNSYSYNKIPLNSDQINAINSIKDAFKRGKNTSLIYGVTGCGKTEIYLNMVEQCIRNSMGAIILVPEISLTPQTVQRFKGRFGDIVAVIHSRLSEGEKFDEWNKIKNGDVKVIIGARSAVFSPVKNLKLIVIDEEHEYSYKSDNSPKYLTSEVADYRVKKNNGILILGSATPSLESYYKAKGGIYNLVTIENRVEDKPMPEVSIIDMRSELKSGNRSVFSRELINSINNNLENKEQTILFLNRRGYATFVSCRECGYVLKCKNCDVSLTYHFNGNKMTCHYCGMEETVPTICPSCSSKYIRYFGSGTEKIETEIKRTFPQARVIRMDLDTTRKKGQYESLYNKFKNGEADILIGTQMISKGMDFPNVTLVGVIAADTILNLPDFRASERTFQLLTQVAGRAGRGDKLGKVIIQTYDTEHYSIVLASKHDYKSFYSHEINIRNRMNLPPFSDILYVFITSENEDEIIRQSMEVKMLFRKFDFKKADIKVLGPTPCYISKVKNIYRWHMMLKGDVIKYYDDINEILFNQFKGTSINYTMDVNPYNMF